MPAPAILVWMEAVALMETITTHVHVLHHFMEGSAKVRNQFRLKSVKAVSTWQLAYLYLLVSSVTLLMDSLSCFVIVQSQNFNRVVKW